MSEKEMTCRYPAECWIEQQKTTLFTDLHLEEAGASDLSEAPQTIFGHFSRLVFHLINAEGKRVDFNLRIEDFADVAERSRIALTEQIRYEMENAGKKEGDAPVSPCYTVQFKAGNLKGKTPAQVLIEDPENGPALLNSQYKWLQDHCSGKFAETNKAIMAAIKDAGAKFKAGELNADVAKASGGKEVEIVELGLRSLRSRTRPDGKVFVYDASIVWKIGAKQPVAVTIANYYAPVSVLPTGQLNVDRGKMDKASFVKNTMNLTEKGWMNFIKNVELNMESFANEHGPALRKKATKLQIEANQAYKDKQNG